MADFTFTPVDAGDSTGTAPATQAFSFTPVSAHGKRVASQPLGEEGPPESKKADLSATEMVEDLASGNPEYIQKGIKQGEKNVGKFGQELEASSKYEQDVESGKEKYDVEKDPNPLKMAGMYGAGEDIEQVGESLLPKGSIADGMKWAGGQVRAIGNKLGIPKMVDGLLNHAYGSDPIETAQGFEPKVGPAATEAAKEPPVQEEEPPQQPEAVFSNDAGQTISPQKPEEPQPTEEKPAEPAAAAPEAKPKSYPAIRLENGEIRKGKTLHGDIDTHDLSDEQIEKGEMGFVNEQGQWLKNGEPEPKKPPPPVDKATSDLLNVQETNPAGEVKYVKIKQLRDNPDMMKVDPETYQFKQGVDEKGVKDKIGKFNENLSGPLTIHHTDAGDYVVDGHHRFDAGVATGADDASLKYQILNGTQSEVPGAIHYDIGGVSKTTGITVQEARAYGALKNIADQRGTAFDMAKFMRDSNTSPEDLESMGYNMAEAKTNDAQGMARLSPFLWDEMQRGNLPASWGVEIGNGLAGNLQGQEELYKEIAGQKYSSKDIQNLINLQKGSPEVAMMGKQQTLGGGGGWGKSTTFAQQAKLASGLQENLEQDARKMGGTAGAKEMLEKAGGETKIDKDALATQAKQARQIKELLPKFVFQSGTASNMALRKAAYDLAENPKAKATIMEGLRNEIGQAVRADADAAGLKFDDAPANGVGALDPQKSMFSGGTTLAAGLPPQAVAKAASLAKAVAKAVDSSKSLTWMKKVFAPEIMGPAATRTTSMLEEQAAELRAQVGSMRKILKPLNSWFGDIAKEQRFQVYGAAQNGDLSMIPEPLRPIMTAAMEGFDKLYGLINDIKGGDAAYRQNYLPQMWANDPADVDKAFANIRKNAGGKSLQGPTGFLKQRKYDDVVEGIAAGLNPKFENPMDMLLKGYENQWRFVTGQHLFDGLKESGLATFLKEGDRLPKGMQYIDDRIAKARSMTSEGMVQRGSWIMPEEGARIVNNYTAPGYEQGAFRSLSALGNLLRVEFSGFHTLLTSNSAADMDAGGALIGGLGKIFHGDTLEGMKDLAKVPKTWTVVPNAYKTWSEGNNLLKTAMSGHLDDPAVRDVIMGGGSFDFGDSITTHALVDAMTDKMGLPGKVLQKTLGFTMRNVVAPMKLGAFQRLYGRELEDALAKNGGEDLTYVQRRNLAQGVRKHIDNVMGQIARDNLHTTNKFKDVIGNIVAFPGWNIGSVRLFGGMGRGISQLATGKPLDMQARLALQYAAGKALRMGVQGAILNRLIAHEWPTSVYEYMTIPTGKKDSNGNMIRMFGPEYLARDIGSFAGHYYKQDPNDLLKAPKALLDVAESKANWPLAVGMEIVRNANYFGKPITFFHTEGWPSQMKDIAEHILGAGVPFSATNTNEQRAQAGEQTGPLGFAKGLIQNPGQTAKEAAIAGAGLTPASRSLRQTDMQNYVDLIEQNQVRQTATSPQEAQKEDLKRELRTQLRAKMTEGDKTPINWQDYIKKGVNPSDIQEIVKQSQMKPLEAALHRIPIDELGRAYDVAKDSGDQKDADLAKRVMAKRFVGLKKPEDRAKAADIIRRMYAPKKDEAAKPTA